MAAGENRSPNPSAAETEPGRASSKNQKSTRKQIKREPNFRFLHNEIQHATRCKLEIFHWNPNRVYIRSTEVSALPPSFD
jgi:hypothetical protein